MPSLPSIDECQFVSIKGIDHWVTIRGSDTRNPALLLVGGPAAAFSSFAPFFEPWERAYTLVQWDQPGGGATFARNLGRDVDGISVERLARDAIAIAEFALRRLEAPKLVLLCMSAGTIVGLKIIRTRPNLFSAYVGTGQVTNWGRQDSLSYSLLLDRARARGDMDAVAQLEAIGKPPYVDTATDAVKSKYAGAPTPAEQAEFAHLASSVAAALAQPPASARYVPAGFTPGDARAQSMTVYDAMRIQITSFDAFAEGLKFDVPMFFFQGEHDVFTVTSEVEAYCAAISAPVKKVVLVPQGGHGCLFLRSAFLSLLESHVRPMATRYE